MQVASLQFLCSRLFLRLFIIGIVRYVKIVINNIDCSSIVNTHIINMLVDSGVDSIRYIYFYQKENVGLLECGKPKFENFLRVLNKVD